MKKILLLFGGQSPEHDVSLMSAKNIFNALDKDKYIITPIYISRLGTWFLQTDDWDSHGINEHEESHVNIVPGGTQPFILSKDNRALERPDIIFPLIHGSNGEDGRLPALCELLGIPYVGCDVLSSALCMDKAMCKLLVQCEGLKVAPFLIVHKNSIPSYEDVLQKLGVPLFIKPANAGSSIGVSRVDSDVTYKQAIDEAFKFDTKILIEQGINGDEVECAILGNNIPKASALGRIIPQIDGFYSYEGKYIDSDGAALEIPAAYNDDLTQKIQTFALRVYKTLGCSGLARVDMFVTQDHEIYLNEVNTMPGFTDISMYPKLWEVEGLSQKDLLDTLVDLGIERYNLQN